MIPMGFVSPTGTFYECDYQGHSVLADKLCDSLYPDEEYIWPSDFLVEHGWAQISMTMFLDHRVIIFHEDNKPWTIPQKEFFQPYKEELKKWMSEYEYNQFLEDIEL